MYFTKGYLGWSFSCSCLLALLSYAYEKLTFLNEFKKKEKLKANVKVGRVNFQCTFTIAWVRCQIRSKPEEIKACV